jgi:protein-S-isoprenylcysteine O-methyltransferase Ste14
LVFKEKNLLKSENHLNNDGKKGIVTNFIGILVALLIILISAGKINWLNGWLFFGLILSYEIIYVGLFLKVNPELLNERSKLISKDSKFFDKIFAVLYLPLYFSILIISGIDVRSSLTTMPLWLTFFGIVIFLLASLFSFWAMYVNPFFECSVRIQEDSKQKVVTKGPYKIVRHPGYIAGIITILAAPLILGSWWGLIPSSILIIVLIIRTALEDRALKRELSGYMDYTMLTRYRLIPFIW